MRINISSGARATSQMPTTWLTIHFRINHPGMSDSYNFLFCQISSLLMTACETVNDIEHKHSASEMNETNEWCIVTRSVLSSFLIHDEIHQTNEKFSKQRIRGKANVCLSKEKGQQKEGHQYVVWLKPDGNLASNVLCNPSCQHICVHYGENQLCQQN